MEIEIKSKKNESRMGKKVTIRSFYISVGKQKEKMVKIMPVDYWIAGRKIER